MNWSAYITLASLATVKFMFSAIPGPHLGVTFLETAISIFIGGTFGAAVFYYSAEFFMNRTRIKREKERIKKGGSFVEKNKFTRVNKGIVKLKNRFGKLGICFWAPFLLSVPLGSIVVAKFFGRESFTFLFIIIGMAINATLTTFIVYVFT